VLLLLAVPVIVPVANPLELVPLSNSRLSAGPRPRGKELRLLQAAPEPYSLGNVATAPTRIQIPSSVVPSLCLCLNLIQRDRI
jgi:hypothetical protein